LFLMPGTSTTSTYTLSLHDALPIWLPEWEAGLPAPLHELHVRERQPGRSGVALAGAVRSPRPLLAAPLATGQRGDRPLARSLLAPAPPGSCALRHVLLHIHSTGYRRAPWPCRRTSGSFPAA